MLDTYGWVNASSSDLDFTGGWVSSGGGNWLDGGELDITMDCAWLDSSPGFDLDITIGCEWLDFNEKSKFQDIFK